MNIDGFIQSRQELKEWIDYESKIYHVSRTKYFLQIGENAILYKHQKTLRKCEYHHNSGHRLLSRIYMIRLLRIQNKYCLHVPINTCKKGLHIMHVGPVLINGTARLGENCSLHINTAIVAGGTNDIAPVVGDNVVVGVGASVVGDVHVSDGVAIGANSVVCKSINESNIAVAGAPARKVSNNGTLRWRKG